MPVPSRSIWIVMLPMSLLWFTPALAAASACQALSKVAGANGPPAFLTGFPSAPPKELSDVAFTYDNAVAAVALISCRETAKAARIGDAMLSAQDNYRYWHDGRLRNGYLSGAATAKPLKLPGWWDSKQNMWVEDQYQMGSDDGNQAWAILAFLALYRAGAGQKYLKGAERIGTYVEMYFDTREPAGFNGGVFGDEPTPV
jgi:hypothetical protein